MTERDQTERLRRQVEGESPTLHDLVMTVLERQDMLIDKIGRIESELSDHTTREEAAIKLFVDALPANPDGSPDALGHKQYHTALIEEAREKASFYRELKKEFIRKGFWGLVWVTGFLAVYWWNTEVMHKHGG